MCETPAPRGMPALALPIPGKDQREHGTPPEAAAGPAGGFQSSANFCIAAMPRVGVPLPAARRSGCHTAHPQSSLKGFR